MEAYWASQALARMAVRDFVEDQKPSFDYVILLPSVVIGPDERISSDTDTTESLLQGTRADVLVPALTSPLNSPLLYVGVPVHVADVARAHVDAVNGSLIPGNSEYILSSDTSEGIEWDDEIQGICKKYFAQEVDSEELPLQGSLTTIKWRLDGMSTEKTFGWKFTSFEETMKGLVAQYLQLKQNEKA